MIVASLEKTGAYSAYSAGRVFLGLAALAFMARSVDVVSFQRVAVARGVMKRDPHHWTWLMMNNSTARLTKCSGGSTERYWQSPSCSREFNVVSFRGLMAMGQVFLER